MFVKPLSKYNKTTKQRYSLYQLCESYRLDGRVRHRVIIGLGKQEELPTDEQKIQLGKRIEEMVQGKMRLSFDEPDEQVERLARHFYNEILTKRRYDTKSTGHAWQRVDVDKVKNKEAWEIGAEWLCKQAFDQLNISGFLHQVWLGTREDIPCCHPYHQPYGFSCIRVNDRLIYKGEFSHLRTHRVR